MRGTTKKSHEKTSPEAASIILAFQLENKNSVLSSRADDFVFQQEDLQDKAILLHKNGRMNPAEKSDNLKVRAGVVSTIVLLSELSQSFDEQFVSTSRLSNLHRILLDLFPCQRPCNQKSGCICRILS